MTNKIRIPCVTKRDLPVYAHEEDAGADVKAYLPKVNELGMVLPPGKTVIVPTGIVADIPTGYEIQVRPRSGLAAKNGITVLNTPGTIDSLYKDEIKVILHNTSNVDFYIQDGMRIAQFVPAPVLKGLFESVGTLKTEGNRGGGLGSTGK